MPQPLPFETPRSIIELDVSYQPFKPSGIATYSRALAQELVAEPDVRLILCVGPEGLPAGYPDAEVHQLTRWDRIRVRRGRIRLVPHQMRPAPVLGTTVVTVLDVIHLGHWTSPMKRTTYRALIDLLRVRRTGVLSISHAVRTQLLALGFGADRVAVCQPRLPERPEDAESAVTPACGPGGIVYVGNLRPHKDVATLVRAQLRIATQGGPVLHLVTGDDAAPLRSMYRADQEHLMCVHHRAKDEERDAVLRRAAVCVTSSLEEGFGYVIDEALGHCTPVIATLIPAHVENSVGRDVTFFPPGDTEALAALLTTALTESRDALPDLDDRQNMRHRVPLMTCIRRLCDSP